MMCRRYFFRIYSVQSRNCTVELRTFSDHPHEISLMSHHWLWQPKVSDGVMKIPSIPIPDIIRWFSLYQFSNILFHLNVTFENFYLNRFIRTNFENIFWIGILEITRFLPSFKSLLQPLFFINTHFPNSTFS